MPQLHETQTEIRLSRRNFLRLSLITGGGLLGSVACNTLFGGNRMLDGGTATASATSSATASLEATLAASATSSATVVEAPVQANKEQIRQDLFGGDRRIMSWDAASALPGLIDLTSDNMVIVASQVDEYIKNGTLTEGELLTFTRAKELMDSPADWGKGNLAEAQLGRESASGWAWVQRFDGEKTFPRVKNLASALEIAARDLKRFELGGLEPTDEQAEEMYQRIYDAANYGFVGTHDSTTVTNSTTYRGTIDAEFDDDSAREKQPVEVICTRYEEDVVRSEERTEGGILHNSNEANMATIIKVQKGALNLKKAERVVRFPVTKANGEMWNGYMISEDLYSQPPKKTLGPIPDDAGDGSGPIGRGYGALWLPHCGFTTEAAPTQTAQPTARSTEGQPQASGVQQPPTEVPGGGCQDDCDQPKTATPGSNPSPVATNPRRTAQPANTEGEREDENQPTNIPPDGYKDISRIGKVFRFIQAALLH